MTDPTKLPNTVPPPDAPSGPDANRRRLLRGGLGAAPLLTLISRPVLGANQCFTPSGFLSMPTSQHGQPNVCTGRTPGYWKQHPEEWPGPYYPSAVTGPGGHEPTRFAEVFSPSPYPAATTLLEVLEMGGGPPNDVARHVVAALLNAASNRTPVHTVYAVQNIWREYATMGYFEPTAGVRWYHAEIVDYLTSTMPL